MYFSHVRVDPTDDQNLYVLGISFYRSTDGGKTFRVDPGKRHVHADQHALWIDPHDGRHMLIGTDGGFYVTYDRMANWDHLTLAALGQFYHVAVDNRKPYHVYGGLQDNGSWGGPSRTLRNTGPINEDWFTVSGGDGFVCRVDPDDPDIVYTESQDGVIGRRNLADRRARRGSRAERRAKPPAVSAAAAEEAATKPAVNPRTRLLPAAAARLLPLMPPVLAAMRPAAAVAVVVAEAAVAAAGSAAETRTTSTGIRRSSCRRTIRRSSMSAATSSSARSSTATT